MMLQAYRQHAAERAALGIPPLPLSAQQTGELIELLKAPPAGEEATLIELITHRVPAGVDDAAKVKASVATCFIEFPLGAAVLRRCATSTRDGEENLPQ